MVDVVESVGIGESGGMGESVEVGSIVVGDAVALLTTVTGLPGLSDSLLIAAKVLATFCLVITICTKTPKKMVAIPAISNLFIKILALATAFF